MVARSGAVERTLGIVDTKAIAVAAELGLADLLAGGASARVDLAATSETDADALGRLLRFLVGRGVFTRGATDGSRQPRP